MLQELYSNVAHNLFKPLLLFFYAGFAIPLLKVKFEFPKVLYQSITLYLLLAIGWHGGEELAGLPRDMVGQALGFMLIGFATNTVIGFAAYAVLRRLTSLRRIDAATVAGFYGSDSAGTFLTCVGVLTAAQLSYASYMPVMLAVMEIPGCLVALFLVSRLRKHGLDAAGNCPDEAGFSARTAASPPKAIVSRVQHDHDHEPLEPTEAVGEGVLVGVGADGSAVISQGFSTHRRISAPMRSVPVRYSGHGGSHEGVRQGAGDGHHGGAHDGDEELTVAERNEAEIALQSTHDAEEPPVSPAKRSAGIFSKEMLHEVFLNPGIFLLFAGIGIGFVSRLQGERVISDGDKLFVSLFQGVLCLFLLEMGMTASRKLKDLAAAGPRFIAFGLFAPNVFATFGMLVAHGYSLFLGQPLDVGTYVLFAVLCGAASYIALPAVQRMAIPEASPTLPLAASLGLTFSYNVTIGIPVYIVIAKLITSAFPVYA